MFRKFIIYMISGTNEFIENAMQTRIGIGFDVLPLSAEFQTEPLVTLC